MQIRLSRAGSYAAGMRFSRKVGPVPGCRGCRQSSHGIWVYCPGFFPGKLKSALALGEPSGYTCTAICRIMVDVMAEETPQTTARLEARLPNDVHALLKRAAEIEGRTLTDFVVSAAREAACRTIEATEIIRLSVEDQRQIAEALLNPPEPTPALKKAFQRRRELLGGE